MNFQVVFDCDNAAFADGNYADEIDRILKKIGHEIVHNGKDAGPVIDINGNKVGDWSLEV